MKLPRLIIGLIAVICMTIAIYSFLGRESQDQYIERIEKERKERDNFMRFSGESPLPDSLKRRFKSLTYYLPNIAYRVNARLILITSRRMILLPTNDGASKKYVEYAYAEFTLGEKQHRLTLLQPLDTKDGKDLFLAFTDETSARETYGGGRYIDLRLERKNSIIIDFNLAYNPFCVYNGDFSCPIPPKENYMDMPVPVGEKNGQIFH